MFYLFLCRSGSWIQWRSFRFALHNTWRFYFQCMKFSKIKKNMGILLWNTYKKKNWLTLKLIHTCPYWRINIFFLNSYHAWFWSLTKLYHIFEIVYVIWDNKTVNLSNRISIIDTKTSNIFKLRYNYHLNIHLIK